MRPAVMMMCFASALQAQAPATSVLAGFVTDSTKAPLAGAEVSLPDLKRATLTDERGRFRLDSIPPGNQRVSVKRVGYSPLEATVDFNTAQVLRRFELTRVVALDSVKVTAPNREVWREEFENQRKLGIGHFLTREEIAKIEGGHMSALLSTMPNVNMVHGPQNYSYITTKFAPPLPSNVYKPEPHERRQGVKTACYSRVYLDNMLMNREVPQSNGAKATPPFDVNSIPPTSIEAIEFYASSAQVPLRYASPYAECGVLVIHTRR